MPAEIIGDHETAQTNRNFKHPRKSSDERYRTSSLLLSYNLFSNIDDLSNMLFRMLQGGPAGLAWLDLSFNCITAFDSEVIVLSHLFPKEYETSSSKFLYFKDARTNPKSPDPLPPWK